MNYLDEVIYKIRKGDIILWAGSGFSHYAGYPSGDELVKIIKKTLSKNEKKYFKNKNNLPDVAEEFVQLRGRDELYKILHSEFNKEPLSTKYHRKLSEIPQIKNIITTNYDGLFEKAYKQDLKIICSNSDLPEKSSSKKIKLYKIHGSLNRPETIIITQEDYRDFFHASQYDPLWSTIKALIAQRSILFIGYSFEDQNIKFIFENILEKIGNTANKGYLVVPKLPPYKIEYLKNKYSIEHIGMKAENVITKINKEIKEHVLEDYNEEFIDEDTAIRILQEQNIIAETTKGSNKRKVSFKKLNRQPFTINATIKPKGKTKRFSELIEFIKGKRFGEYKMVLKEDEIEMKARVGKVNIPLPKSFEELTLEMGSLPKKEFKAHFTLKLSDKNITGINGKSFLSQNALQVNFQHPAFIMELKGEPQNIKKNILSIKLTKTGNLIERKRVIEFLHDWLQEDSILIHTDLADQPLAIKWESLKISQKKKFIDKISIFKNIYTSLEKIQKFYNFTFKHEYLNRIEKDDIEKINELIFSMEAGEQKVDSVPCELEPKDENSLKNLMKNGYFDFRMDNSYSREIDLLGNSIKYCMIIHIEGQDCYIDNSEEVKKQLERGERLINLNLKSKSNNLLENWEPIDCSSLDFKMNKKEG